MSNVSLNALIAFVGFFTEAARAAIPAIASFFIVVNPFPTLLIAEANEPSKNIFSFWKLISILTAALPAAFFILSKFIMIAVAAIAIADAIKPIELARITVLRAITAAFILPKPPRIALAFVPTVNAMNPAIAAARPVPRISRLFVIPTITVLAAVIAPANKLIPPTSPILRNRAETLSDRLERRPGSALI